MNADHGGNYCCVLALGCVKSYFQSSKFEEHIKNGENK